MRSWITLGCLAAALGSAHADNETIHSDRVKPVPATSPAPVIRIVQPANKKVFATKPGKVKGEIGEIPCLLDSKDRVIKLAADHLGAGMGVLVVVDGVYAAHVKDPSKPIDLEDLEPYNDSKTDAVGESAIGQCGWHWIAAMPITAKGQMLDVEPTISWYLNDTDRRRARNLDELTKQPLIVINWPLLGKRFVGTGRIGGEPGWITSTPGTVTIDARVAQVPECDVVIEPGDEHGKENFESGMLVYTKVTSSFQLQYNYECKDGGGTYWGGQQIYLAPPKPSKTAQWPR